jgi:hypothetical protein
MQADLQMNSRLFGFFITLSRTRIFTLAYLAWGILSIFLLLPISENFECSYLLCVLVEGFFSFMSNEWRDDFVLVTLF